MALIAKSLITSRFDDNKLTLSKEKGFQARHYLLNQSRSSHNHVSWLQHDTYLIRSVCWKKTVFRFKYGLDSYLLLNSCLTFHACQVKKWNILKTPIIKTKITEAKTIRQQLNAWIVVLSKKSSYFTFDTFENQLGPLQTPGYGHLLQTGQKTQWCVGYVENINQTKNVCGKVEGYTGKSSVERAQQRSRRLKVQTHIFATTIHDKLACFINTKQL